MHNVFCIIGRTASGKSTLAKKLSDELGLKILKSYTTRSVRANESLENSDHTFITEDQVEPLRGDMVAYTERAGYVSFATKQQLLESDIYIINPSGYHDLVKVVGEQNIPVRLVPIYIKVSNSELTNRAKRRGQSLKEWALNYDKEYEEFDRFEDSYSGTVIWNDYEIDDAYNCAALYIKAVNNIE